MSVNEVLCFINDRKYIRTVIISIDFQVHLSTKMLEFNNMPFIYRIINQFIANQYLSLYIICTDFNIKLFRILLLYVL